MSDMALDGYIIFLVKGDNGEIRLIGASPDQSQKQKGDEIVELNGIIMHGLDREEIVFCIEQGIKSKIIKLKINGEKSGSVNLEAGVQEVLEAYVIAVVDEARLQLESLADVHCIKPFDISHTNVQQDSNSTLKEVGPQEFENVNSNNRTDKYTKLDFCQQFSPEKTILDSTSGVINNAKPVLSNQLKRDLTGTKTKQCYSGCSVKSSLVHTTSPKQCVVCTNTTVDELKKSQQADLLLDYVSNENVFNLAVIEPLLFSTELDKCSVKHDIKSEISEDVNYLDYCEFNQLDNESEIKCDLEKTLTCINTITEKKLTAKMSLEMSVMNNSVGGALPGYQNTNMGGYQYSASHSSQENVMYNEGEDSDLNDNPGSAHREMAIDVPVNFVGQKKEPPRYPTNIQNRHSVQSSASSQQSTPSRVHSKYEPPSTPPLQKPPKMSPAEEMQHHERIKKYQEDLRKKREMEENFQREQDFLRNSLRDSQKLQSLEQSRVKAELIGVVNPNYMIEEEDTTPLDSFSKASTLPVRDRYAENYARQPLDLEDILTLLKKVQGELKSLESHKDVESVAKFFQDPRVLQALYIHNKVVEVALENHPLTPVHNNSQGLVSDLLVHVPPNSGNVFADELRRLLQKTHFKHLMVSHDGVAKLRQKPPNTTTEDDEREYLYERASQYGEESIKIVRLQKTADPLGATVRNEAEAIIIGRIVKGGAAEKSGLLHEGDEILEINGSDVRGKSIDEVCSLMSALTGTLTFLIVPSQDFTTAQPTDKVIHYKTHFDYDPEDDPYIPCRELGISFRKGDILHVIKQTDANWWQAYRDGEDDQNLAGLIPSRAFQEQKEAMMQTLAGDKSGKKNNKCSCRCGPKHGPKNKKKQMYNASGEADQDAEEILTYEEVSQYYPQPNRKRPVVLIGPPNVGRQELRQRLMESDLERFAAAVPHTSRHRKDTEVDGQDYHFVPRHIFESDIVSHKFVEYGEYEKNLYGTSLEAIRSVVTCGKICVLNLHPQSLRILKASDLKPYVVFIAPPNIEKLKQLRQKEGVRVSDDELRNIIEKAREMEENYGHYFDFIIINYELDRAYDELLKEINRLEVEPQWVPSPWVT